MHPIAAFCRRNLNALGLELYSIAYPLLPKDRRDWLFEKNVNIVLAETGVKIIDKDEESVTIGKFNKDGTYSNRPFRILTTTDIHLGDTPSLRRKAMQMLANHIAQAKPDLVIFTGDIILSKFQQLDAVQFARFMEKTGVYWAIVFGNHEVHEEKGFYKCHRSYLVALNCVETFSKAELRTKSGARIPISRDNGVAFKDAYFAYMFPER